jgi:hypothetical protein
MGVCKRRIFRNRVTVFRDGSAQQSGLADHAWKIAELLEEK